jgi:hypothetical protein
LPYGIFLLRPQLPYGKLCDMTTKQPPSRLTRFRIFWEALDVVMTRRGLPPPSFAAARDWFESELEPEAVGELLEAHSVVAVPAADEASR